MPSMPPKALIRRLLPSLALCAQLSACAPPIVITPPAINCRELLTASGLLAATPGAALPANDTVGEIAAFGDRQTGQLDKANSDKAGADGILAVCERRQAEALKAAKPRRWWQLWR